MKNIPIQQPRGDKIKYHLASLYYALKNINPDEAVHFDLSGLSFISPLLISSLSIYIKETNSTYRPPQSEKILSYLNTIAFPRGLKTVSSIQKRKNYLPLSVIEKEKNPKEREEILNCFYNLIFKTINNVPGAKSAIAFPIAESTTNIFEHSEKYYGIISGQIYPKKEFLEICIIDRGIGIADSYNNELGENFTDITAIKQCMLGLSSKQDHERGYGIRKSKKLVCEGIGGEFILLSGNAGLLSSNKEDKIFTLPKFYWKGVIISYRIPFPNNPIDYTNYLE